MGTSRSEMDKPASLATRALRLTLFGRAQIARSMLAGRTNPALAGSGVGCGLAGRFATSWYTVGMRLAGRHLTCPTVIHSVDHLLPVSNQGMRAHGSGQWTLRNVQLGNKEHW